MAKTTISVIKAEACHAADYIRQHGPFESHRLPLEEMEYTTLPLVMEKVKDRFLVSEK